MSSIASDGARRNRLIGAVLPQQQHDPLGFDADRIWSMAVDLSRRDAARVREADRERARQVWQRDEARATLLQIVQDYGINPVQDWLNSILYDSDGRAYYDARRI